jgi:hypothetical protein
VSCWSICVEGLMALVIVRSMCVVLVFSMDVFLYGVFWLS